MGRGDVSGIGWEEPTAGRAGRGLTLPRPTWGWAWWVAPVIVSGWLATGPGAFAHRAHLLLGGLCAQTPGHTFGLGDRALPFDARMTGIYLGALLGFVALVAAGRTRAARPPAVVTWAILTGLVGAMGVDGTNSLLADLGVWHPYAPDNWLRVVTGTGAGVALAVVVSFLVAATVWSPAAVEARSLASARDVVGLVLAGLVVIPPVALAPGWAFVPVSLLLIAGATVTIGGLVLVSGLIVTRREGTFGSAAQLRPWWGRVATGAVTVIVVLAGLRSAAEMVLGPGQHP